MRAVAVIAALLLLGVAAAGPGAWARLRVRYETWRIDRDPDARCRLAAVQLQLGEHAKALEIARAVLRRHPKHAVAEDLCRQASSLVSPRPLEEIMHSTSLIAEPIGSPRGGCR